MLSEDPLPDPSFDYIVEWRDPSGRMRYVYFDDLFPYVVVYRVFPLDATSGGLVKIIDLIEAGAWRP